MQKLRCRLRVPNGSSWPRKSLSVSSGFPSRSAIRMLSMTTESAGDCNDSDSMYLGHQSPVTCFTEDESMVRDAVRSWANAELKPLVRQMDDEECLNPEILQQLFDIGFMAMVRLFEIYLWRFSTFFIDFRITKNYLFSC